MIAPGPIQLPAKTIAWVQIVAPASTTSGSRSPRGADDARDSAGGLPSTTASWITQPSPMTTPGCTTTWAPNVTSRPTVAVGATTRPGGV